MTRFSRAISTIAACLLFLGSSPTIAQSVWYRCPRCGRMHQRAVQPVNYSPVNSPTIISPVVTSSQPTTATGVVKPAATDSKTVVANKPIGPAPGKTKDKTGTDNDSANTVTTKTSDEKSAEKKNAATAANGNSESQDKTAATKPAVTKSNAAKSATTTKAKTKKAASNQQNTAVNKIDSVPATENPSVTIAPAPAQTIVAPAAPMNTQQRVLSQVNNYRARNGLGPLSLVNYSGAEMHSQNQASRQRMYHDPRLPAGWYENVGWNSGYADPVTAAVNGWIKSAPHRRAMLTRHATIAGVGVSRSPRGSYHFTLRLR